MNLKNFSNDQLISGLKKCIDFDFRKGATMVAFIEEVDRRRLFLNFHFNSLFAFLTEGLGMKNGAAQLSNRFGQADA